MSHDPMETTVGSDSPTAQFGRDPANTAYGESRTGERYDESVTARNPGTSSTALRTMGLRTRDADTDADLEPDNGDSDPHTEHGELSRLLAEVKGQSQFLLYLADQIEDSLGQLGNESEESQITFLGKILTMYGSQLEQRYDRMGATIANACEEVRCAVAHHVTGLPA